MNREESVQHFLDLIKKSRRGKFKIYIGMIAGVGKSYRMLQEAHDLLDNGVDVQIGYVETHGRAGTEVLLEGLPVIPRRKIFYKAKELEEMTGRTFSRIHVVGGGSNAGYLNELTARATGKEVHAGPGEATAIGNITAQMLKAEEFKSIEEARTTIHESFGIKVYQA